MVTTTVVSFLNGPSIWITNSTAPLTSVVKVVPATPATTVLHSMDVVPFGKTLETVHEAVEVDALGHKLVGGTTTRLSYEVKINEESNRMWHLYGTVRLEFPVPYLGSDDKWDGKTGKLMAAKVPVDCHRATNVHLLTNVKDQYKFLSAKLSEQICKQRTDFLKIARDNVSGMSKTGWVLPDEHLKISVELTLALPLSDEELQAMERCAETRILEMESKLVKLPEQPTKFMVKVQTYDNVTSPITITVTAPWPWASLCGNEFRSLVSKAIKRDTWAFQFMDIQIVSSPCVVATCQHTCKDVVFLFPPTPDTILTTR